MENNELLQAIEQIVTKVVDKKFTESNDRMDQKFAESEKRIDQKFVENNRLKIQLDEIRTRLGIAG